MKNFTIPLCMILLILILAGMTTPITAYTEDLSDIYIMYVNNQQVGVVKFPARALSIYDNVERRQRRGYQEEVFIDSEIHFKKVNAGANKITEDDILAKAIVDVIDINVDAYSININGTKVGYVKSTEEGQKVVDLIMEPYIEKVEQRENSQLKDVKLKQDIQFEYEVTSIGNVLNQEDAMGLILHGSEQLKEYKVKQGDTLWQIARKNGVSLSDLEIANPDLEGDIIQPGDIIKIGKQEKLLTVITQEEMQYSMEIPFETETRTDNKLERGRTRIVQQGKAGQRDIVALVTREDGQEVGRDILEEKVVKEPVKHIQVKGTYVKPLILPDRGTVSGSGSDVVAYAKRFLNYRYVFATAGPRTFDCSGFVKYVYGHFGVQLYHSAAVQQTMGVAVSAKNLRPGDLVYFKKPIHIGIYIGNGQFIHAANSKRGVVIDPLNTNSSWYAGARRIFK